MSPPAAHPPSLTVEEYLRLEETSTVKHEYVAWVIHALAGASKRHNRIVRNILTRLTTAARGGPCQVYFLDVKLRIGDDAVCYPNLMVTCEPDTGDELVETAPAWWSRRPRGAQPPRIVANSCSPASGFRRCAPT